MKSDLRADWGRGAQACDLAGSCPKLENNIYACSPEHYPPKRQGTSAQKRWTGGKDFFSFSVLGGGVLS